MTARRTPREWLLAGLVLVQRRKLWCAHGGIVATRVVGDPPERHSPRVPNGLRLAVYDLAHDGMTTSATAYMEEIGLLDPGTAELNRLIHINSWGPAHLDQIALQGLIDA